MNSTVINYTHADTGLSCVFLCVRHNKYCRSINFNVTSNSERNCEFLKDVSTEKPELLLKDEDYDYYILLSPNRVSTEKKTPNSLYFRKKHCREANVINTCITSQDSKAKQNYDKIFLLIFRQCLKFHQVVRSQKQNRHQVRLKRLLYHYYIIHTIV